MRKLAWTMALLAPMLTAQAAMASDRMLFSVYGGYGSGAYDFPGYDEVNGDTPVFGAAVGWQMDRILFLELGYMDLGEITETIVDPSNAPFLADSTVATTMLHASMGIEYPITRRVSFLTRIGVTGWQVEETYESVSGTSMDDDSGVDLIYGLGLRADLSKRVSATLEYQMTSMSPDLFDELPMLDYQMVTGGLHFAF